MGLWTALRDAGNRGAVLTDFDGTLSVVVNDPAAARALPGAAQVLRGLAERYGVVAVVSGRPVSFLIEHLDLSGSRIAAFGLYGLEQAVGDHITRPAEVERWRGAVTAAADAADAAAPERVTVERKGLTVTLHVRNAPDAAAWAHHFATAQAIEHGLGLHIGRKSYELSPPLPIDKGTVVATLIEPMSAAAFMGDDRGDLPAFDALDRFAEGGGAAIKVAVRSDEVPPELVARADEVLDGPLAALALLESLL